MAYMRDASRFAADIVENGLVPTWLEVFIIIVFAVGFATMRPRRQAGSVFKKPHPSINPAADSLCKSIEAEMGLGKFQTVVNIWRATKACTATPISALQQVCEALLAVEPEGLVQEIIDHMMKFPNELCNESTAMAVLSRMGRTSRTELLFECFNTMQQKIGLKATPQMCETLIAAYAYAGKEADLAQIIAMTRNDLSQLTSRHYAVASKGLLKAGKLDAGLFYIEEMQRAGFPVPPFAVTEIFRIGNDAGNLEKLFEFAVRLSLKLTSESLAIMLEHCTKTKDHMLAHRLEGYMRTTKASFTLKVYDSLLKLYACVGDKYVIELFEELQRSSLPVSEGLCVGLLTRCAESQFLVFANKIIEFARANFQMTITLYSALMKVYAYCGMYDAACDLYPEILRAGLEPDQIMYSCFMKFAVECNRPSFLQELSHKVPTIDLQNSMSLIRAAMKDKDVRSAVAVLERLKSVGVTPDVTAYNAVLNVCAVARDLASTQKVLTEMKLSVDMDLTSYNTAIKAFGACGDAVGAHSMLKQMQDGGVAPNDVSYNCLINMSVSEGKLDKAWQTVDEMLQRGIPADRYTVATMMKAARGDQSGHDLHRALSLLNQSGLNVCDDEVLLNSVLEVCIRHRFHERLEKVLDAYWNCTMRPAPHTYATLIRSCGVLRLIDRAWALWREMVNTHHIEPSDIALGCMLDALVSNGLTTEAEKMLMEWKAKIPPNAVMYSTLLKGYASDHKPVRAMQTLQLMRKAGMQLSTKVYNSVIDAFARSGRMDDVAQLLDMMQTDGFEADNFTQSLVVKGYCIIGDLDKAFQEYEKVSQTTSCEMDTLLFNNLLDGCVQHNRMTLADKLVNQVEFGRIQPSSFTLAIVIKMWGRRKNLDQAFAVMESWPGTYNFQVNGPVHSSLLSACLKNNATARGLDVFKSLRASGHGVHSRLYGSLICSCIRVGFVNEAVKLAGEAYGLSPKQIGRGMPAGQTLETHTCDQLLKAIEENHLQSEAGSRLLNFLSNPCSHSCMDSCTGAHAKK